MRTPALQNTSPLPLVPQEIAAFVRQHPTPSNQALQTAAHALLDTLATAILALKDPSCVVLLGPLVPGTNTPLGARLPGTNRENDPASTAADIALCASWHGLHSAWPGPHLIHTSECFAPLLATADWLCRNADRAGQRRLLGAFVPRREEGVSVKELLCSWIMAAEIHGQLAREMVQHEGDGESCRLAAAAMAATVTRLLGGGDSQICAAVSHAISVGCPPSSAYSATPLAAADAAARSIVAAARAIAGAPAQNGFPPLRISAEQLGCSIVEQTLFNIAFPDTVSAQTALEASVRLHTQVRHRIAEIERIDVATHEAAVTPSLSSPPNGDSLAQAAAVGVLFGRAEEKHFLKEGLAEPRLAALRERVVVHVDPRFSEDYKDPDKQSLANAVQIVFRDGTKSERVTVEYPIGHYRRRTECVPLLFGKAEACLHTRFEDEQADDIIDLFDRTDELLGMPVDRFVDHWIGLGATEA